MMMIELGFAVRPPVLADAESVTALLRACEMDHWGTAESTIDEVRDVWTRRPDFNLATDAWVVIVDGRSVGYAELWAARPIRLSSFGRVSPEFRGRGIGGRLCRLIEGRAREPAPAAPEGLRVVVDAELPTHDCVARSLFEARGFTPTRYFRRMVIDLQAAPAPPVWPEGITVRPIVAGEDDYLVYATNRDAFMGHWGFYPTRFDAWRQARMTGDLFDPSLWFLAMAGAEATGVLLCNQTAEACWVSNLGVRREWRKRGIGEALIRHAFGEFYRRGRPRLSLGVDSENPSGAVALYERAGMRVTQEHVVYEKELRPGAEFVPGS